MTRARLILTLIAVFAIIGGVLAFKGQLNQNVYVRGPGSPVCNVTVHAATFRTGLATLGFAYATLIFSAPCPQRQAYYEGE